MICLTSHELVTVDLRLTLARRLASSSSPLSDIERDPGGCGWLKSDQIVLMENRENRL